MLINLMSFHLTGFSLQFCLRPLKNKNSVNTVLNRVLFCNAHARILSKKGQNLIAHLLKLHPDRSLSIHPLKHTVKKKKQKQKQKPIRCSKIEQIRNNLTYIKYYLAFCLSSHRSFSFLIISQSIFYIIRSCFFTNNKFIILP